MAAGVNILELLGPSLIKTIAENLQDPSKLVKINSYKAELTSLTSQLLKLQQSGGAFANKYSQYLNQMDMSLSAIRGALINEMNAEVDYHSIVKKLFILEHKIMDTLTDNITATTEYAVYYEAENAGNGILARGTISADKLYGAEGALKITDNGIYLSKKSIIPLFEKTDMLNPQQIAVYQDLAKTAIKNMESVFKHLDSDIKNYKKTLNDKTRAAKDEATKKHLGYEKWNQYMRLRALTSTEKRMTALYERYTFASLYGPSLRSATYNRGHLVEALERYIQSDGPPSGDSLSVMLNESVGNSPWFAGGDVGTIQVKGLFSGRYWDKNKKAFVPSQWDPTVQVASMESILALANELIQILTLTSQWARKVETHLEKLIEPNLKDGDKVFDKVIEKEALLSIQKLMKDFI